MKKALGTTKIKDIYEIVALGAAALAIHLLPFLHGSSPLGYDTGFYRRYLTQQLTSFPNTVVPGLGDDALVPRIIFDALRILHLPTDAILYGSYLLTTSFIPILLYIYVRHVLGRKLALLAGIFCIFSAVAFNTYWFFLWKNAWALCLLLLALIFIRRNWLFPLFAIDLLLAFSHKTTAVVYICTLAVLFLITPGKRVTYGLHVIVTGLALLCVNFATIHEALLIMPSAVFLEWQDFITLAIPFLLLIVAAYPWKFVRRVPREVWAFTFVSFMFPLFHLPFYERIFVFSDVSLLLLATFAVGYILERTDFRTITLRSGAILLVFCIAGGFLFGNLWNQVTTLKPLLTKGSTGQIAEISKMVPHDATLLTTADEAPWYEGWTTAHIAAPGLLHDNHNLEEWTAFWSATSSADQIRFLNSFPAPLYISTLGSFKGFIGTYPDCVKQIAPHLLYNTCPRL